MTTRLNLQITEKQKEAINAMAADLGTTKVGVFKTALSLLGVVTREQKNGNRIAVIEGDRIVKELTTL